MKTQVTTIIRDVEIALGEIDPNQAAFIGDRDHADLQTMIESKIEECVDEVHRNASISRMALDATEDIVYTGDPDDLRFRYKSGTGVLYVLLKSYSDDFDNVFDIDMLRLVSARSENWPFTVHDVVYPDDPLYEIVTDRYVGAQVDFPAVTMQKRQIMVNGNRGVVSTLELRCLSDASDWASITVIPRAKIRDGLVDVDSALYHKLIEEIVRRSFSPRHADGI